MDLAIIISAIFLIPIGLGIGWAIAGGRVPEAIVPEENVPEEISIKEVDITDDQKMYEIHSRMICTVGIFKARVKEGLNNLIKSEIMFFAEHKYGIKLNKNLTKPLMIDAFINQLAEKQKEEKKDVKSR